MLLLNTILIVGLLLGVARAMWESRRQRRISIVTAFSCSRSQGQSSPKSTSRHERPNQELGDLLAYLSQIHGVPFETGELFFVKTGLSPYCHYCLDDFIPRGCPACEWSSRHHDLIDWRDEALVKLAKKLKVQRSTPLQLDVVPSNELTASLPVQ